MEQAESRLPAVLDRMFALWNGEEIDAATVYVRGCTVNGGEQTFEPEEVVERIEMLRAAIPDLHWTIDEWFSAGTRYVLRVRATGTHTGAPLETPFGSADARGTAVSIRGIEIFDIRDDLVVDACLGVDWSAVYAALGARF